MQRVLRFEIKQNLRRAARIYVKSQDMKLSYGYFHADDPSTFDGWDKLSPEQITELTLFIQNIEAVNTLFGEKESSKLIDFRFRLPIDLVAVINELTSIISDKKIEFNLFESAITGMMQQLKIAVAHLPDDTKRKALTILDKVGLAEYKKQDLSSQIQAVFSELLALHNKSEKLHEKAKVLFEKNKSYSPRAIEGMAKGETLPSKWLVACAIDLLLDERHSVMEAVLSENDLFVLWAKPLLDHGIPQQIVISKAEKIGLTSMEALIKNYKKIKHK